jgi:two-component system nitrogen regulation sensor histidine kinase NtrY
MLLGRAPEAPPAPRRLLDSPRLLVGVGIALVALLVALFWLASRTRDLAPDLVTGVLLYAVLAIDLALLAALGFVLARNIFKLWIEERRAAPFGRFRAKLVVALLLMTVVPAGLVLVTGSQMIRESAARWFSEPVDEVLDASHAIARRYYQDTEDGVTLRSRWIARQLPPSAIAAGEASAVAPLIEDEPRTMLDGLVEVYRVVGPIGTAADVVYLVGAGSANLPPGHETPAADRLAARALASGHEETAKDDLDGGGALVRAAAPVRNADQAIVGVVVASQYVASEVQARALQATAAFENYQGLKALQGPIQGIYQSVFLAVTLLILISATWLGLYLAKRITRPVQMLAAGARAIGAGQLDVRLEAETGDEFGALVESFNMMAAELETSRARLERSQRELERTNLEVDARRRYIETILERVATGVISIDEAGRLSTANGAAERLLGLGPDARGRPIATVFDRDDLRALRPLVAGPPQREASAVQEITLVRDDREIHLAAAATPLVGDRGQNEGSVLVLDDVTPLIRAQRVAAWRDVARRLAHEIKNPLTPIQLSAERLRRHFGGAPPQSRALVAECTDAIVSEVEALKGLVDEFAQFARLRAPRLAPLDVHRLVEGALQLYAGVLQPDGVRVVRQFETGVPLVSVDAEQMRQVIINLVDNALEVLGGPAAPPRPDGAAPAITIATACDAARDVVRIVVSDNGPGVTAADRDKLFMPYYSTKGRGSGLGLAIVRRIVVEHGGTIEVAGAIPTGTAFTIELPCLPS